MKLFLILFSFTIAFIGVIIAVHVDKTIGILLSAGSTLMFMSLFNANN
jgi:hypothetical protein